MTRDLTQDEILGLLDWQRAMGADASLDEVPVDWLARGPVAPGAAFAWPEKQGEPSALLPAAGFAPPPARTGPVQPSAVPQVANQISGRTPVAPPPRSENRPQPPLAPSAAETEARRAARSAVTLEALETALRNFDGCALKATATNLCFYRGAPAARVMIVGEAPGRDEDIEGKPFVGRAGQLLDKMLASIGLDETKVHITNIVYWRPPGNRTPTPHEALACRPFLERQIELVSPDLIVALGGAAAKELFAVQDGIMRLRGKWRTLKVGQRQVPALATLHPAYLLRTPAAKGLAWADLLAIKAKL
jgi:DNA polymerase